MEASQNPLLRVPQMAKILESIAHPRPDVTDSALFFVRIGGVFNGGSKEGQIYWPYESDLSYDPRNGLILDIPDRVAEALRQQGARAALRDVRAALGISG